MVEFISGEIGIFNRDLSPIYHINHLDEKLNEVTASVTGLESKFELLKTDLEGKFELLRTDIEVTIQKALNKNMLVLVAAMGFFLTLSKLIDKL
ncbi:MAG: hypothetical protein A6F72_06485 [Cycloclasticus sp. symbiont of Poecilosclerida sp. N]|nr:MAG: hypothetical protein A6F72_06485 [Cycloclasticus sp. symbiont of Poecilosclerida sp. N]